MPYCSAPPSVTDKGRKDLVTQEGSWKERSRKQVLGGDGCEREMKGSSDCGHLNDCNK
jgi:hypothetical protein